MICKINILAILILLSMLLFGCTTHINQVKDKWGEPAKVEYRTDTIVYYYYFPIATSSSKLFRAERRGGRIVVEIITNREGKILNKRKYWKQPTATAGKLMKLNLKMTKLEVISTIGEPTVARGSMTNKHGQVIEIWEYALYKTDDDAVFMRSSLYWLYFCMGKLVQWGEAGDWEKEADRIYEIRFR